MELDEDVRRELLTEEFIEADSDMEDMEDDDGEESDSGWKEEAYVPSDFESGDDDDGEDIEVRNWLLFRCFLFFY